MGPGYFPHGDGELKRRTGSARVMTALRAIGLRRVPPAVRVLVRATDSALH